MKNLSNITTMSSREIAELTGKEHYHVMEAIRNMEAAWVRVNQSKFRLVEYTDAKGEKRPMYQLSKTECLYIATKFNDEARAKLVIRWEELENKPQLDFSNPDTVIMIAQNWKEEQQKRIAAEKEISILKPKAELMDKVLDCGEKIDVGQAAKILKLPFGRNKMFAKLREMGIFFKQRNEPKQEYIDRKYFEVYEQIIPRNSHDSFIVLKVLVTQKGLSFLDKTFRGDRSTQPQIKIA